MKGHNLIKISERKVSYKQRRIDACKVLLRAVHQEGKDRWVTIHRLLGSARLTQCAKHKVGARKEKAYLNYIAKKAISLYSINEESADSQLRLGDLYRIMEKNDLALMHYLKALALGSSEAQVQIAYLYYREKNKILAACFAFNHPNSRAGTILTASKTDEAVRGIFEGRRQPQTLDEQLLSMVLGINETEGVRKHKHFDLFKSELEVSSSST